MTSPSVLASRASPAIRGGAAPRGSAAAPRRVSLAHQGGAARRAQLSVRAAVMNPGEQPPKEMPRPKTEAVQTNTNPLSAESAVPVNKKAKGEPVRIKIDEQWYDCRGWAAAHPGGERWIHFFDGRDGTDVFYALHSYGPNGSSKARGEVGSSGGCQIVFTITTTKWVSPQSSGVLVVTPCAGRHSRGCQLGFTRTTPGCHQLNVFSPAGLSVTPGGCCIRLGLVLSHGPHRVSSTEPCFGRHARLVPGLFYVLSGVHT
jgi:cytochrome b involved in lipid metabolism